MGHFASRTFLATTPGASPQRPPSPQTYSRCKDTYRLRWLATIRCYKPIHACHEGPWSVTKSPKNRRPPIDKCLPCPYYLNIFTPLQFLCVCPVHRSARQSAHTWGKILSGEIGRSFSAKKRVRTKPDGLMPAALRVLSVRLITRMPRRLSQHRPRSNQRQQRKQRFHTHSLPNPTRGDLRHPGEPIVSGGVFSAKTVLRGNPADSVAPVGHAALGISTLSRP